ncbi:MAG: MBL fold metallo-hydrolase [Spirochaetaceae bacterium]|jgi:phosphoribosyl 1,2-cyclic phosphodiesterase|nr:MBL fold metallo-hydrolase [Spirochaetaceae bacterium]
MFYVRFWGVRGSIARPGKNTIKFGGNTTCLEIRANKKIVIIDMGTGIYELGKYLTKNNSKNTTEKIDIFITHTHLDHINGFQMFMPFFIDTSKIKIYGPHLPNKENLQTLLAEQMSYNCWPVELNELPANISFKQIGETTLDLGDGLIVKTKYLNHPAICLGYRFEYKGKSIVTAFDNEPFWNIFDSDNNETKDFFTEDAVMTGNTIIAEENNKLLDFYKNANIIIYDSQYTDKEYNSGKKHWGHSTYSNSIETGILANAKKIVFFHHDPSRTDNYLNSLEKKYKNLHLESRTQIIMSKEGMILEA